MALPFYIFEEETMSILFALATLIISGYLLAFIFKVLWGVSLIMWAILPIIVIIVLILLLFA